MLKLKPGAFLIAILLSGSLISCSDDNNPPEEAVDLIVGQWLVVTENDYFCGTHVVRTEKATDQNQVRVYNADGTWQDFEDGVPIWTGTWENLGNGMYSLSYNDGVVEQSQEIEFLHSGSTMRFGIDNECVDFEGDTIYTYTVWVKLRVYNQD